jgi:hypothetical protein
MGPAGLYVTSNLVAERPDADAPNAASEDFMLESSSLPRASAAAREACFLNAKSVDAVIELTHESGKSRVATERAAEQG